MDRNSATVKAKAKREWIKMRTSISSAMEKRGLTSYEIAKRSGLPASTIRRMLSGERIPSVENYLIVLEAMKEE